MGLTNIQWADYTFNAWMGCRKVAEECENCYIVETPPFRFRGIKHGSQRERTSESNWKQPLLWNRQAEESGRRARVFCLSLGDWLDDEVPIQWLADLLALIESTPCLDWLLLTKRPKNWIRRLDAILDPKGEACPTIGTYHFVSRWRQGFFPENVWIGVSQGADQFAALDIPARIHFLSCEPMLRPLNTSWAAEFDWIIFGGESGRKARVCDLRWIRDGLAFCAEHEVAAFVKQLGAKPFLDKNDPGDNQKIDWDKADEFEKEQYATALGAYMDKCGLLELRDGHGGDILEWPEEFRVREFPVLTQESLHSCQGGQVG